MIKFFEPKEDFNHLVYDRSGLLETGLVRLANGASRSSDQWTGGGGGGAELVTKRRLLLSTTLQM